MFNKPPQYSDIKCLKNPSEESIHTQIANYLQWALSDDTLWYTIENSNQQGGYKGMRKQAKLKQKGVRAGVPDIYINFNGNVLYLEVKSKTGVLSRNQKETHKIIRKNKGNVAVVRSVDDVEEALKKHSIPHRIKLIVD